MRTVTREFLAALLCSAGLLAGCSNNNDDEMLPVDDTVPSPFSFVDQTDVAVSTVITSAPVTITNFNSPATVTVTGGSYSVGCTATYISTASTISNNQTVCARHTSAATASTATTTTLTVGGVSDAFTSTTASAGVDTTPAAFSFTDQTGVAASTVITSAPVTITGINAAAAVSVAGGSYSVGCTATYISTASTINNNQTVCARHTSAATASTATTTTLTVGGVSDAFTSTTASAGVDTTPAAFSFTDQTGVAASTVITSAPVTITGINAAAPVTVTGGSYSVGCTATYISTASTINNNQTVCARHTSAATASTATTTTLTVGGVSDAFSSTTAAAVADTTPAAFSFTDQTDVAASAVITSAPVTITGINAAAPVSATGGSYSVGCTATYISTASTINNNQTVCARHTSSATASTATTTTLTVGGVSDAFTSTTAAAVADTTPAAFSFTDQTDVAASTVITSAPVTITGINAAAAVSVTGGTYSVGCTATYISTASTINNNQTVCARHTSSATASTATTTTLTVGGVSDAFSSTTAAAVADTTPAAFSFADQTDVAASAVITSAPVTITGINAAAPVSVTGGSYSVGCTATYISTASTISNNQTVCARHTSAATASTATTTTLTVGGVSDAFSSTTVAAAGPVTSLLPFLTGTGDLRLMDPTAVISGSNPVTVDTNLAPPATGSVCDDCFEQAELFFGGSLSGGVASNVHAARLVYAKRGLGNDSGGAVFKVNLVQGAASNLPVRISSLTDACRILNAETTDFASTDNSFVVIERAGADLLCSTDADNRSTVIRLNTLASAAGIDLPLIRDVETSLHARTNASGVIQGYVSLELVGAATRLVRRDANLANPVTLLTMADTTGANIARSDLTHLFITATPVDESLKLFRLEADGTLSPVLYSFTGFNAGNPIQDGLRDGSNLYFSDANQMLRIPVDSVTENAVVMTTLAGSLRISGNRALDSSTSPRRLVFEAQDDAFTVASGVFSLPVNASAATPTVLSNYPDSEGGNALLVTVTNGRAYINVDYHGGPPPGAVKVNTDGTGLSTIASAYWGGLTYGNSVDLAQTMSLPVQSIILANRTVPDGIGNDRLSLVSPATGTAGIVFGNIVSADPFLAVRVVGLGRYTLVRSEMDRFGNIDYDTYFLDAMTAASLAAVAETTGANDIPLDD